MASENNCLDEPISDNEKVRIVSDFILSSPPGEFREVVNDVRILLANDSLLKEHGSQIFAEYAKEQLTPVKLPLSPGEITSSNHSSNNDSSNHSSSSSTLVTRFNELGANRYIDPRTKKSFKYDYLRDEASDLCDWSPPDASVELWRSTLDDAWSTYAKSHYTNGNANVFASMGGDGNITLTACIEGHQFQPKNYWNGRWRSVWTTTFNPSASKSELKGELRVHVHYYEDGNVQLITNKEIVLPLIVTNEVATVKEFVSSVEKAENEYQTAISENYQTMSDTTFKALRRPLPLTRAKIEWNKILTYRIGNELNKMQPC